MIRVSRLTRAFGQTKVIQELTLKIAPGERVCIQAPSGSGKTTLVRLLAGLDRHYSGRIRVGAVRLTAVFQDPGLFPYLTIGQNMRYGCKSKRSKASEAEYKQWLSVSGLHMARDFYPREISGGMKQKAAIIRAFLPGPDLVLMDEPFKSLDPESKTRMADHILKNFADTTLFMTTHHEEDATLLDCRVILFRGPFVGGHLIQG